MITLSMRRSSVLSILLGLLAALTLLSMPADASVGAQDFASQNDLQNAADLLAALNAWRVSENQVPLYPNPTLERMAVDQAAYIRGLMAAGRRIDNFHIDSGGLDPQQRAYSQYGWQTYGTSAQIEISENAAVGSVRFAINYWRNSDIHRRAALSATYREVGVAAIPATGDDTLFIVVFGARPGILPVLVDAGRTTLYLSRENSRYSSARGVEPQIRLFNEGGQPITRTLPWSLTLPIPAAAAQRLLVLYTMGDVQAITSVDLQRDVAALTAGVLPPTAPPAVIPSPTPTLAAVVPTATLPPTRPGQTATNTPIPTATLTPTFTPTDMPDPDLIITYDRNSLVIRAVSTRRPNLTGLRLINGVGNITTARWLAIATFPADAFPQNQCLVLYRAGTNLPQPTGCAFVRSAIQVDGDRIFWMAGPFDVQFNEALNRSCPQGPGQCLVKVG